MKKKSTENRRIVLEMLEELEKNSKLKEHALLRNVLNKYDYFDRQDKAFITYLFEGVIRNRIKLDYIISNYAKAKKLKSLVRNILRMGIFQILYMDSVPDSAACNESVNLMIDRGLSGLKGFVNAVLRTVVREKNLIQLPDINKDFNEYLSVEYSMPKWIVEYVINLYGTELAVKMFKKMSEPQSVIIRLNESNPLKLFSKDDLLKQLKANGNNPLKHPYLESAYIINQLDGLDNIPGFYEGYFTVQDVSSQLAIDLLNIKDGDYVLDLCSAPGGKAMHAAVKALPNGKVDARDISEYKLKSINENARRLGISNISVSCADAVILDNNLIDKVDVLILDAPCSGLGIMGKKSDIRYNMSMEDIKALSRLQRQIIDNAVLYLKKGGYLLYSTCTITKEENMDNRKYILDKGNFESCSFEDKLPKELKNQGAEQGYLQLLPAKHMSDGFFISIYRKIN